MSEPLRPPTAAELRGYHLSRMYQHRSLVRRIEQRVVFTERLAARARGDSSVDNAPAALDLLYSISLLIEQTRKAYEVVASHVDLRFAGRRKSLDSRIHNPRSPEVQATYHQRVWLYPVLDDVPDSAFTRLGLDPLTSRHVLRSMMERSAAQLADDEKTFSNFAQKYDCVCSAYKHGRAVFFMRPEFKKLDATHDNLRLHDSIDAITALRSDGPGELPHAFVTFTPDDDFWSDVERVMASLPEHIGKFSLFIEGFTAWLEAALQQLEAGTNDPGPAIRSFFFVEPATDDEFAVLAVLKDAKLLLYEPANPRA